MFGLRTIFETDASRIDLPLFGLSMMPLEKHKPEMNLRITARLPQGTEKCEDLTYAVHETARARCVFHIS